MPTRSIIPLNALTLVAYLASVAGAQQPVSRADAIDAALRVGPRLAVARADTVAAFAGVLTSRALPNPALAASYTKDVPSYHAVLDIPFELPSLRSARARSADAARVASQYRYTFERAAVSLDADTTYTRALAALAHAQLSRRNAQDGDSLRRMALARREAGDASDLDVELATVSAGQQANVAAADSLTYLSALLDLQTVMGLATDRVEVQPTDSLVAPLLPNPESGEVTQAGTALQIAAAEQSLSSAEFATRVQRRSIWSAPSLLVGFDTHDPSQKGLLPVFGIGLPIPLFNLNRGPIAQAAAEEERARAELAQARVEGAARAARAARARDIALSKVARDRALVASANRVAAMSLTAYREGQASLPNVLEAQRNARDILGQYIDDVAAAWNSNAALRVFTLTAPPPAGAPR